MEIKTLQSFVALAKEGSVSAAANAEHISQPALSRQLAALEKELGCQLYTRSKKGIRLTRDGVSLYHYALSILSKVDEAEQHFLSERDPISGAIHIGCGDSASFSLLAQAVQRVTEQHPGLQFHFHMGTSAEVLNDLHKGFYDLVLECEVQKHVEFNMRTLPIQDTWALLVQAESPLASLKAITPEDLVGEPLIISRQALKAKAVAPWAGDVYEQLKFVATFNLGFNVMQLVDCGVGSAFVYKEMLEHTAPQNLRIVPLSPAFTSEQALLWRKGTPSPILQALLDEIDLTCEAYSNKE